MALDVQISFSWTNYCRLCLEDGGIMLPLFEGEGHQRKLSHKIETSLQIVTYDGDPLPRRICHTCLYKLNQMYEFRSMVWSSYERLKLKLLPLQHVAEVRKYLEKANHLQKTLDSSSLQLGSCSTPIPSSSSLIESNSPMIRVKSEEELMQAPDCSSWPSSTSFPPLDPIVTEPGLSCTNFISSSMSSETNAHAMESALPLHTQSNFVGVQPETLKRKRLSHASDSSCDKVVFPVVKKLKGKRKQLAGPLSRKRNQESKWKCVFCQVSLSSKQNLNNHLEKCLKCPICKQEFSSVAEKSIHEAQKHVAVFIDCGQKHLSKRCSYCPARFASSVMLSKHNKEEHCLSLPDHSDVKPPVDHSSHLPLSSVEIDDCCKGDQEDISDSEDQPLSTLQECMKTSPAPSNSDHICKMCKFSCDSALDLQDHMREVHGRFKCLLCEESFASKNGLSGHGKYHIHRSKKETKVNVNKNSSILKNILVSSKKKLFKCNICFEGFEEEDAFILHLYVHATEFSDDESIPVKKNRKAVEAPKKPATVSCDEESDNSVEQFSVKCERCHVVCRSKEYYQIHLATHMSKVRTNFPCSGCNQDFRNVEALNRHTCCGKLENMQVCCLDCGQALVEGADHVCDNKCPACEKVFKSARGQRLHFVSKHKQKVLVEDGYDPLSLTEDEANEGESDHLPEQNECATSPSINVPTVAEFSGELNPQFSRSESPGLQLSRISTNDPQPCQKVSHTSEDELSQMSDSDIDVERTSVQSASVERALMERLPPDGAPVDSLCTSLDLTGKSNPLSSVCDNSGKNIVPMLENPPWTNEILYNTVCK